MKHNFYVFGGTFDPPHQGHVGVLKELKDKTVILAPTFANPFKKKSKYSFEQRILMLKKVLDYEKIDYQELSENIERDIEKRVLLSSFKYEYVTDLVDFITLRYNSQITWVIGPDLVKEVKTWKNWDKMNLNLYVSSTHANNLRSTEIRAGNEEIHPALVDLT